MAKFFYTARDRQGKKKLGVEMASTSEEVITKLQAEDLIVVNVVPEELGGIPSGADKGRKGIAHRQKHVGVRSSDLVLFCRQLATLLSSGVTILKSLDIIAQQVSSQRLFKIIKLMQRDMEAGASFHEAMAKHPRIFSDLWINLVESGEASGNLAMVLGRLASYLERSAEFKSKVVSALTYPIILTCVATFALLFLTIKIIPTFAELFKGFEMKLPALTEVLIKISVLLQRYFLIAIAGLAAIIFLLRKYLGTKPGRKNFEQFLFHLPGVGEFFRVLAVERFTSEMSTLVESGVPILYSLEIAEHSVGNLTLGEIIHKIQDEVREGRNLSVPLQQSGFFDPMAVQMVAIGEEIGELSSMFKRLSEFYEQYANTFLTRVTAMFEPLMLVVIGGMVGVIVVGMFLPVFQIAQLH